MRDLWHTSVCFLGPSFVVPTVQKPTINLKDYKKQRLATATVMKKTNPQNSNTQLHFLFRHLKLFVTCKVNYVHHNTVSQVCLTSYLPAEQIRPCHVVWKGFNCLWFSLRKCYRLKVSSDAQYFSISLYEYTLLPQWWYWCSCQAGAVYILYVHVIYISALKGESQTFIMWKTSN